MSTNQLRTWYSEFVIGWYDFISSNHPEADPRKILLGMLERLPECQEETRERFFKWGQYFVRDETDAAKQRNDARRQKARQREKQETQTRPYHPPMGALPAHVVWNDASGLYLVKIGDYAGGPVILKVPDLTLIEGLTIKARRTSSGKFEAVVAVNDETVTLHRYVLSAAPEQRVKAHDGDFLNFGKVRIAERPGWYSNLYIVSDSDANPAAELRQHRFERAWSQVPVYANEEGDLVEVEATLEAAALPAQSGKNSPANEQATFAAPSVEELQKNWHVRSAIPSSVRHLADKWGLS